ncbi:MAG: hypothetical protein ACE5KS_00855 [Woeseiaceae bacterium]
MPPLGRLGIRPRTRQERYGAAQLTPAKLIREIVYPFTDMAVLAALTTFLLLGVLAAAAGLLGLWLALVILPAYFRYLLYLLEARAHGRGAPSLGIELFNWVENFWSLFPLVLLCLVIWGEIVLLRNLHFLAAVIPAVLILFPASMAVLAMTRSPAESVNPAAIFRLVRACGRDYLMIPLTVVAMSFVLAYLSFLAVPGILIKAGAMYTSFLLFTLTGTVLHENAATIPVDIPPQREPDAEQLEADLTRKRTQVLNHAYGFVSRGNRQGGLQHIDQWIDQEVDSDAAYRWFFEEMLKWESTDAALFFAQDYLSRLLSQRRDVEALKLINRCLLENARFRPLPGDVAAAQAAADRQRNDELAEYLRRR